MEEENIIKSDVFKFFNYKWERVPTWGESTEDIYRKWYLKKYNFVNEKAFSKFLCKKTKCVDIGAGLGRDVKFFRELAPELDITAVDQSATALNVLKKNNPTIKIAELDITDSEMLINTLETNFDFISCDQVLHHMPNPEEVLNSFAKLLKPSGILHFFVCRKKNEFRDIVDDTLMHHSRNLTPERLWQFAETVTMLGKELHEIHKGEIHFKKRKYPSLQNYVHNQVFRCWYNPDVPFELCVSSNYDWFSNNPRYTLEDIEKWMNNLVGSLKLLNIYSDDASIAVVAQKVM
jgi:SAM-dependent methyltransferase